MKKLILLLCLLGIFIGANSQVWEKSDGTIRALNADLTLKNPVPADKIYNINGETFKTKIPVCPKYYRHDNILGIKLTGKRLMVKYTGYVRRGEWIGRIVWKEIYHVDGQEIKLQGFVDGNYVPPQSIEEKITFQDE